MAKWKNPLQVGAAYAAKKNGGRTQRRRDEAIERAMQAKSKPEAAKILRRLK